MIAAAVIGTCVVLLGAMFWIANAAITDLLDEPWNLEDDE